MEYIISDHHFGHENIISYTNRPHNSVEQMDSHMKRAWNQKVDEGDVVYHLGDFVYKNLSDTPLSESLNGNIVLVTGNHDDIATTKTTFPVVEEFRFKRGKYDIHCVHRPENAPDTADWVFHGHTHRDDPLIDTQNNQINVCVENLGYTPLRIPTLLELIDKTDSRKQEFTKHAIPL